MNRPNGGKGSRRRNAWAKQIKARAGYRCEECGKEGNDRQLHAHHVNGVDTDHRMENGRCLCVSCHLSLHYAGMNVHHTWTRTPEERSAIALAAVETRRRNGTLYRTMCRKGLHEFTPENTYSYGGHRECRACREEGKRRRLDAQALAD